MDRRSFFRFAAAAPVAIVTAQPQIAGATTSYRRLSTEKGDPGERAWAELAADGHYPEIYLDGVKQDWACTADVDLGMIRRAAVSPKGNIVSDGEGQIIVETVYGQVDIRIKDDCGYSAMGIRAKGGDHWRTVI